MTTIGVAIPVPEPWGEQLKAYRTELGDTSAEGIPTHVTLVPPFEVTDADLATVEQHLVGAAGLASPFRLHLRGTGTFRPVSPVVFVVVVDGISACEQLASSLRRGPLAGDLQFPYHPHVTLAHRLSDDLLDRAFQELAGFECRFEVTQFSLYVHHGETGWRPTRHFQLGAAVPFGHERG